MADSGAGDTGVDERADGANSADASSADASSADARAADASESDTGQVDSGQAADAGVQDARITDDAMPDAGDTPAGSAGCGAGQSPPSGFIKSMWTARCANTTSPCRTITMRAVRTSSSLSFMALAVPLNANWGEFFGLLAKRWQCDLCGGPRLERAECA